MNNFRKDLASLINCHSKESDRGDTPDFVNEIVEAVKLDTTYITCVVQRLNRNIWNMILSVLKENGILVDIFDEDGTPIYESSYVCGFMFTTYLNIDKFGRQAEQHTQIQFYKGSLPGDNVKGERGQVWIDGVRHLIIDEVQS